MKRHLSLMLFLLCFTAAVLTEKSALKTVYSGKDLNAILQKKLESKAEQQRNVLIDTSLSGMVSRFDVRSKLYREIKTQRLSLFAYKNKCLVFWSDNVVQPYYFGADIRFDKKILRNSNGWYQMVSLRDGPFEYYCYYNFYRSFPNNNDYFTDAFSKELRFGDIQPDILPGKFSDIKGSYIEYKGLPELRQTGESNSGIHTLAEFLYLASFVFFLLFALFLAAHNGLFNTRLLVICLSAYTALFNFLAFFNLILRHKLDSELFSPELAAYSNFIPSVGHAILFSVAVFSLLVFVHQLVSYKSLYIKAGKTISYSLVSLLHWASGYLLIMHLLPQYILNARINYDFKFLANVSYKTLIGLFTVFIMFFVLLLFNRIMAALLRHRFQFKPFYRIHVLLSLLLVLWAYFIRSENGFMLICFVVFGLLLPVWVFFTRKIVFRHVMAMAVLTAAVFSVQFEQANSFKEKENRKLYASKLIAKEDIELEIKLRNIEGSMIHSSAIDSYFYYARNDYTELELNYKYSFFSDFIRDYDISLMRYDSFGHDITPNKLTYDYVNALYNQSTNKSITNYFLYIKDLHYLGGYLAKYEICPGTRNIGYVFLMLIPKVKSDQYNLDFFFSKSDLSALSDKRYSYAIYQKGELVKGLGDYPYKLNEYERYKNLEDESFLMEYGYSRLIKKIDRDTFLIVSLKSPSFNQVFTVFTFLLLFFAGILLSFYILAYSVILLLYLLSFNAFMYKLYSVVTKYMRVININKLYLETKIRMSFLLMSFLICSVVVYFTIQNVNMSFREKQNESLDKKMVQIVSEIEFGYRKKDERPIQNLISHLSSTNEVDINLFFLDGTLYQTANKRIYSEGWFSPYIHPVAYYELIQRKQYSLKQLERIGDLDYQSYYNAVFNEDRNLIGYVHVPYFSRSFDLKKEFSVYLGSLLNLSTLLLMISLLIASYIGRSLVKPLNLMRSSLAGMKLGVRNQAISWSRNDEIGLLVDQYNKMLRKLEESSEKLASSEREGAWKEMAKQVAHEIKNPLTPMKLHLQHLQMSLNRNDIDIKQKVADISKILIEQIDQLSHMAEEFSSFAKMPMAVPQVCDITQLLGSCIALFSAQNNLEIAYSGPDTGVSVYIDKDQMQRVFTNILKNALQAAKENEQCRISVDVRKEGDYVRIIITDNGKGIEENLRDKIFQPNFSTKNSGMGLGLAISKKIIEQVNGNITFESEVNKGTRFHVVLPVYKSETLSDTKDL